LVAALASLLLCLSAAPSASALEIGLMSGESSWEEESGWNILDRSGITVFRKAISAHEYESPTGWAKVETMFRRAAERGITILPYLYGRPVTGSREFPTEAEWSPPANKWETFVYAIVQTYGYNGSFWASNPSLPYRPVTAWEVWNEPNLPANNPGGISVDPKEYARFLKRTSQAVKAAQALKSSTPTQVLFGGLMSRVGADGMSVSTFLEKAANVSGTGSAFNGLSLHPYSFTQGLEGVQTYVNTGREKLTKWFGSSKSLWITELGWNVEPCEEEEKFPPVSEGWQAVFLHDAFDWIESVAVAKSIPVLIWYIVRDHPTKQKWDARMGLLRADSTIRPSWQEFQAQTGAPKWAPPPPSAEEWGAWSGGYTLDLADVNGDGKADIVGRYGNDVQASISTGTKFNGAGSGVWGGWSAGYTLDLADVNGDGKADIVGRYGNDVQVALSDGTKFVGQGTWTSWSSGYTLQLADVNGDGKADIVGRYGNDVQVSLSTGTKFNNVGTWTSWSSGFSMDFSDVNGDGRADLIGRYGANIQAAHSTGSKFEAGFNWSTDWINEYTSEFTDVDGDGRADITGRYGDTVVVFASSGPPPPSSKKWGMWSGGYTLDLADVNGDGRADIVGRYGDDVQASISTGTKFNGAGSGVWGGWSAGYTMQLADVNGDKKADIVGHYGNDVQVALSDGTKFVGQGTWTSWSGGYTPLQLGDVNGDGKADIVGSYGNDVQVSLSTGTKFNNVGTWSTWSAAYTPLQVADVNGDGKADIIGRYGSDVQVAFSDGTKFVGQGTWTTWSSGFSMDFADVNGDGKADIIGRYGTNIQAGYSTGSKFETSFNWSTDWSTKYSAKYADVTGGGKADVIGRYNDYVAVFENL
jgi:hypothetical protein